MSYDLFLTRSGASPEEFGSYFEKRIHYTVKHNQAWYSNEDTGVYFSFEIGEENYQAFLFNMNFLRPHYFALEATSELEHFVAHFQCRVIDEESSDLSQVPYCSEEFIRAWNYGNKMSCRVLMSTDDAPGDIYYKPTAELQRIWEWNRTRSSRQAEFDDEVFVPVIMFVAVDGMLRSTCVWADGVSALIPRVDCVTVARNDLAPRSSFRRAKYDFCNTSLSNITESLQQHVLKAPTTDSILLRYSDTPPVDVVDFVKSLAPMRAEMVGVANDHVLNQELMDGESEVTHSI